MDKDLENALNEIKEMILSMDTKVQNLQSEIKAVKSEISQINKIFLGSKSADDFTNKVAKMQYLKMIK